MEKLYQLLFPIPFDIRYPSENGPAAEIIKKSSAVFANQAEAEATFFVLMKNRTANRIAPIVCRVEKRIEKGPYPSKGNEISIPTFKTCNTQNRLKKNLSP